MASETRKEILENESHYSTLLQKQNTPPKMQLRPLLTNPSLDQFGEQGWRSGESTRLPPMWPGFDSRT